MHVCIVPRVFTLVLFIIIVREQVQEAVFVTELSSVQVSLRIDIFKSTNKLTLASNLLNSRPDSPKVRSTL